MNKDIENCEGGDVMKRQDTRGFEEPIDNDDLKIPRARLLQALSPAVIDDVNGGLRPGMIINDLSSEILSDTFIPIFKFTTWIRFNPRKKEDFGFDPSFAPGDVIWRSNDPIDPKVIDQSKFGENGEKPLATKFLNFFAKFKNENMPVIISFCNSSYNAGRDLLSLARFTPGAMFSRQYKLASKFKENDKGKFFIFTVKPAGNVVDDEFKLCEQWYNTFRPQTKDFKVDMSEE